MATRRHKSSLRVNKSSLIIKIELNLNYFQYNAIGDQLKNFMQSTGRVHESDGKCLTYLKKLYLSNVISDVISSFKSYFISILILYFLFAIF